MVAEARPTLCHDVYSLRDRNRPTLRGAHPRTTARWRPKSELPPPAKSAQVFAKKENVECRKLANRKLDNRLTSQPLPLACVRCLAEVEVIRSLLGFVSDVHLCVSRLGAPCALRAPGASMPLDRACVLFLGLG